MTTVELIDHLAAIFFDLIMPAIGLWVVYVLRQLLAAWLPGASVLTRDAPEGRRYP